MVAVCLLYHPFLTFYTTGGGGCLGEFRSHSQYDLARAANLI